VSGRSASNSCPRFAPVSPMYLLIVRHPKLIRQRRTDRALAVARRTPEEQAIPRAELAGCELLPVFEFLHDLVQDDL
jgi:hypothetical protein